jgi:hypothetical protein
MPGIAPVTGLPRIGTNIKAIHTIVFRQPDWLSDLAGGKLIDGFSARDPGNTTSTADANVLRPGCLMGKIANTGPLSLAVVGAYGTSVLGPTTGALTSVATSLSASAAVVAELVRRQGASGTFKLTGPATANGVARTVTVTYSAASGTTVTITATGVNEVQTLGFTNSPSGTFQLGFVDLNGVVQWTGPITYSATPATLVSNINTAVNTALGSSLVVASGSAVTAIALTFSGAGYTGLAQTLVQVNTGGLSAGNVSVTRTTAGVDGRFVSGSFIQPTDGSETPVTLIPDGYGTLVQDPMTDYTTNLTVPFEQFPIAGVIVSANLVNWPTDTGLQNWIKTNLSTASTGKFVFDDSY